MTEEESWFIDMIPEINICLMYNSIKACNNSFMCQGIKEFGKVPQSMKDIASLNGFVKLKNAALEK